MRQALLILLIFISGVIYAGQSVVAISHTTLQDTIFRKKPPEQSKSVKADPLIKRDKLSEELFRQSKIAFGLSIGALATLVIWPLLIFGIPAAIVSLVKSRRILLALKTNNIEDREIHKKASVAKMLSQILLYTVGGIVAVYLLILIFLLLLFVLI